MKGLVLAIGSDTRLCPAMQERYWIGRSTHEVKPTEGAASLAAASQYGRDARSGDWDGFTATMMPHFSDYSTDGIS